MNEISKEKTCLKVVFEVSTIPPFPSVFTFQKSLSSSGYAMNYLVIDQLLIKLKFVFGLYLLFGGVQASLISMLYLMRSHLSKQKLLFLSAIYFIWYKLDNAIHPLGYPYKPFWAFLRGLFQPLYLANGGRTILPKTRLNENESYLFAGTPHGVVPFFWLMPFVALKEHQPKLHTVALGASLIFKIPGLRELYRIWAVEASPDNFSKLVKAKCSPVLIPGGVKEMIFCEPGNRIKVYCHNKGFIRLALQHGIKIVPLFAFGENNQWFQKRAPGIVSKFVNHFTRGTYPFFPWGSFMFLLPNETPVVHYFGEPLEIPKIENPTEDEVSIYHVKFYSAVAQLVKEKKNEAGFPDLSIEFIGLPELNVEVDPNSNSEQREEDGIDNKHTNKKYIDEYGDGKDLIAKL